MTIAPAAVGAPADDAEHNAAAGDEARRGRAELEAMHQPVRVPPHHRAPSYQGARPAA